MSKKDKSGSAAVQSSAEKVKAQEPVVEPVAKQPSTEAPASEVPADGPIMPGPLPMPYIRNSMLFDLYVAKVASVDTGKVLTSRTSKVYESLFKEAEIALDVYLTQIKQEK